MILMVWVCFGNWLQQLWLLQLLRKMLRITFDVHLIALEKFSCSWTPLETVISATLDTYGTSSMELVTYLFLLFCFPYNLLVLINLSYILVCFVSFPFERQERINFLCITFFVVGKRQSSISWLIGSGRVFKYIVERDLSSQTCICMFGQFWYKSQWLLDILNETWIRWLGLILRNENPAWTFLQ